MGIEWEKWSSHPLTHSLEPIHRDGLWDFVSDETIMSIALSKPQKTPQQVSEALCKEARHGGSEDDVTVITVKITYPSDALGTVEE